MKKKSKPNPERRRGSPRRQSPADQKQFLTVAVGASAGGLEAFIDLMRNLPADTGMAFVLLQHLDPKHHSILPDLISKETSMTVKEAAQGMPLEPDHVYVLPPNASMTLAAGKLNLVARDKNTTNMPIDQFMRSLAEQKGNHSIGVILSGLGTDGTLGIAEIQAKDGLTFVQDEASAKYDGMPRSAIASQAVDYILPTKGIALELARIARHPYIGRQSRDAVVAPLEGSSIGIVFQLLRRSTGLDFTHYRQTTILRRIHRRMVVHKIENLEDYVRYIQTNPAEIKALYQDMLINVTSFFRNPGMFEALKTQVFPRLVKGRAPGLPIRIWTPACASGEETYSVAIALLEYLGDRASKIPIQFFGTDVSDATVTKARGGSYPENISADVSAERLNRFFMKSESGYRISKNIRDMCIFAQHNVLNDPPFSKMDLICCRNLLIYLEPILQARVLSLFHYAAQPGGFLVLGTSEGVGSVANLFSTEDRTYKVFSKKVSSGRQPVAFSLNKQSERAEYGPVRVPAKQVESNWNYTEAQREFDRRLLAQHGPAAVFINEDLEIVHTRGNVGPYLKLAPGRASLSVLKMTREGLIFDLRTAIAKAAKDNEPVKRQNVQIKNGHGNGKPSSQSSDVTRLVNFEVVPVNVGDLRDRYFMILFEDAPALEIPSSARRETPSAKRESQRHASVLSKLEHELAATKEYLQSVIENQEATNEELQSANEEILSSNEELQSTNEELETAKEELQSANEELSTVNDELRNRNLEISQANNDLTNLFSSIDIAVVMIGADLTIRRFTPRAEKMLGMISGDIGRPFININPTVDVENFQQLVLQVISNARTVEKEVLDREGTRFQLRILPYRTAEGKLDGAVVTLFGTYSQ